MTTYGVWEPHVVKSQTIKTAIESACLLLRVDDIVSGIKKGKDMGPSVDEKIKANEEMQNEMER
jgi:T-complex protein 1 subunit gamma